MIQFSLFGIPIRILPWHWLGLAFISGAFYINSADELPRVLVFAIVAFISILSHELGHALVGRRLGGGGAGITLMLFGGYCEQFGARFNKNTRAAMIAAGPGVNIATLILCVVICIVIAGFSLSDAYDIFIHLVKSPYYAYAFAKVGFIQPEHVMRYFLLGSFIWVSFWWSLLNLLPIYPMDGGQILMQYVRSNKTVYQIGFVASILVGIYGFFFMGSFILLIFMGMFAFQNYRLMKNASY